MRLLRVFMHRERRTLMDNDVRLRCIGRIDQLPLQAQREIQRTEDLTAGNDGMLLRLALSYGSRSEIADGMRALAHKVKAGEIDPDEIDEETLRGYLYDPTTPDPDLIIRTAGEMRFSNFLLWQMSYSEFYVTDVCWPEFRKPNLMHALEAYAKRNRKFGAVVDQAVVDQQPSTVSASSSSSRNTA